MPSTPSYLTSNSRQREQALADLERLSRAWQSDNGDVFARLCRRLLTSLELNQVIAIFAEELGTVVHFDRLTYGHSISDSPIDLAVGHGGNHRCEYRLNLAGENLGMLRIFRRMRFAEQELTVIEQMLGSAIHAIRNACHYETVRRAALTDVVTGIPNKRAFDDTLKREACLANRHGERCALILCDLDHFKKINDTYGHLTGDQVLRAAALAIQDATRSSDAVFRIGGEEFGILLPRIGEAECTLVADRIRAAISAISLELNDALVKVSASAGVSAHVQGESADAWFRRTDEALYRAKHDGRNCTRTARPGLPADVTSIESAKR
ncbi:GGDEF domain-containing protein [Marinobacter nanhaiticus D15-8W]|uniref:diguanylate cyclase n=1 Tax=Marinobacter nanhaiticus D15-8W TaxID=626887 RepID=N6WS37_9GAMM|nr:GGDEF domain-containing protein [Marinobacter nanhaiticus]ENO13842.1 GGDEF domain-containing protein [Marinobacter nanhaiticus D15-8W]BES71217.1 GGDEF domain-containing protein [Marinobacter nanhaiticus D15-8W]